MFYDQASCWPNVGKTISNKNSQIENRLLFYKPVKKKLLQQ